MSCNCTSAENFKVNLSKAKNLSNESQEYVVWALDFNDNGRIVKKSFLGTPEQAKRSGACCYYNSDGVEIQIVKEDADIRELEGTTNPQLQRNNEEQGLEVVAEDTPKTKRKRKK